MEFQSVNDALRMLEDASVGPAIHLDAIRYLSALDECFEVNSLVRALQNDDFGVRWEAAKLLAQLGEPAVPQVLRALFDPERVGDSRVREGVAYVIRHNSSATFRARAAGLLKALQGPAADLESMTEAFHLYQKTNPSDCPEEEPEH